SAATCRAPRRASSTTPPSSTSRIGSRPRWAPRARTGCSPSRPGSRGRCWASPTFAACTASPRAVSTAERAAGVLCPLFALRGRRDWGIGEIGHLPIFCRWLADAGHRVLQLLPTFETSAGERSPYAALTAFALDPIYLSLDAVEDFAAAGGEAALGAARESAHAGGDIDYDAVRAVKRRALEVAFARFVATEWEHGSARAESFRRFRAAEAAWLDDYALFRALRERHIARRPARPVRPGRPGLGPARLPLGGDGAERPRLAPRARGARRGALRRRPPRSRGRLLSPVRDPVRGATPLRARGGGGAARARRAPARGGARGGGVGGCD